MAREKVTLKSCHVAGFRSLKNVTVELGNVNVLIGANGSGKSNFLGVFRMLSAMMNGGLQEYVGLHGRASSILHYGPKRTPRIEIDLKFKGSKGDNEYSCHLAHADPDTLVFTKEHASFRNPLIGTGAQTVPMGAGHLESALPERAQQMKGTAGVVLYMLLQCRPYQFHDTSGQSGIRNACYVNDNKTLRWDGSNLAPLLLRLKRDHAKHYERIVDRVSVVAPFFRNFAFDDFNSGRMVKDVLLDWVDADPDGYRFGPHQISDGTLRAMALITLLLLPEDEAPDVLFIDEPELGLHPAALGVIADLAKAFGQEHQIILATQSPTLLQHFDADHVIVADRHRGETALVRHSEAALKDWLDDYSLPELWEKNVLGGRPSSWPV